MGPCSSDGALERSSRGELTATRGRWSQPFCPIRRARPVAQHEKGLCVDLEGEAVVPGTTLITWPCGVKWNQVWPWRHCWRFLLLFFLTKKLFFFSKNERIKLRLKKKKDLIRCSVFLPQHIGQHIGFGCHLKEEGWEGGSGFQTPAV